MAETVVLDPSAVATSRTQLDITSYISASDGVDWGDAEIEAYRAKGHVGLVPVDYDIPNRMVSIPLVLKAVGATSFEAIRAQLQAKVGLFHREGGWISRQTSIGTMYADVVSATLKLSGDWLQAYKSFDINAVLSLELRPDWNGASVTLDDNVETTASSLTKVMKLSAADAVIAGDYPGRVNVVVDEDQGQTQLGLLWGYRSRYYDSATTAALTYEAEALTSLDAAAGTALAGASGGTVVTHGSLATGWTPVLSTRMLAGTADLTHRGSYRVWARCYSTSSAPPRVRLVWDIGDLVAPVENTPKTIPGRTDFFQIDLGEIRLDPVPVGTHRWQGQIQAHGWTGSGENVSIDTVMFQPVAEGAGRLAAPILPGQGLATYAARDEYNQTAGTATSKVLPVGGTYSGFGDADDFSVETTGKTLQRTSINDAGNVGRQLIAGTATFTDIRVRVDVKHSAVHQSVPPSAPSKGPIARWVDSANFAYAWVTDTGVGVVRRVAGSTFVLNSASITNIGLNAWATVTFGVDTEGRYFVWMGNGVYGVPVVTGRDSVFATGGALATGRVGIYDLYEQATASTRNYDNFAAWVPSSDAVLFPNRSAQITTDGMFRQDSAGVAYGPVPHVGDLSRIPPSGLESRKVELFLKGSRGDFDQIPDTGIDDISARVSYRPSWLLIPGS